MKNTKNKLVKHKIVILIVLVIIVTTIFLPRRILKNNTTISNGIVVAINNGENYNLNEEAILLLSELLQEENCRISFVNENYFFNDETRVIHMLLSNKKIAYLTLNKGMVRIQYGNNKLLYINQNSDFYSEIRELIS